MPAPTGERPGKEGEKVIERHRICPGSRLGRSVGARAALTAPNREPSRLAAAHKAPARPDSPSTGACFSALRAGTARGPAQGSLQSCTGAAVEGPRRLRVQEVGCGQMSSWFMGKQLYDIASQPQESSCRGQRLASPWILPAGKADRGRPPRSAAFRLQKRETRGERWDWLTPPCNPVFLQPQGCAPGLRRQCRDAVRWVGNVSIAEPPFRFP